MPQSRNIHFFIGDDYLAETAARKVIEAAIAPELRATAVETVDGRASKADSQTDSLNACIASVQTPPFLDPVKVTWWRSVDFLPGGGKNGKISADVKTALERFAADLAKTPLPENQHLVVTATKLLKTSIFAKTIQECAQITEFATAEKSRDRTAAALARLPELAAAHNLAFAKDAMPAFIAKVGTDTRFIVNELSKLRDYLGDDHRQITIDDIAEISSVGLEEPELWEITEAVALRDPARIMKVIAKFRGKNGFPILLSTFMERFFRELLAVRDALDRGWITAYGTPGKNAPPHAAEILDGAGFGPGAKKNAWMMRRNLDNCRRFKLNELRIARYRMFTVREKLVSSGTDNDDLAITELLRCCVQPGRPAAPRR